MNLDNRVPRDQWPWWVKAGLFGASSRRTQQVWLVLSLVLGIAAIVLAFVLEITGDPVVVLIVRGGLLLLGLGWIAAAGAYALVIRWVDRHGSWARH
jgi:hypothetical protein